MYKLWKLWKFDFIRFASEAKHCIERRYRGSGAVAGEDDLVAVRWDAVDVAHVAVDVP